LLAVALEFAVIGATSTTAQQKKLFRFGALRNSLQPALIGRLDRFLGV